MDTALPKKIPFNLDRNLVKANCTGNHVCTSCDRVVLDISIYWLLLGGFEAINAFNWGTICSCMIFQPSYFIIFFSMKFSIMTSPRYYDVTHFWPILMKIAQHSYVKLEIKVILLVRSFWFLEYLLRKLQVITKITSIVLLPYTSPPIPFELLIRVGSVRDPSFTYLRILFQHKKNNSFYQN